MVYTAGTDAVVCSVHANGIYERSLLCQARLLRSGNRIGYHHSDRNILDQEQIDIMGDHTRYSRLAVCHLCDSRQEERQGLKKSALSALFYCFLTIERAGKI